MADKNINIKIKADSKEAEKGIGKVSSTLNNLAKKVQQNPVLKIGASLHPTIEVFKTAAKAVGEVAGLVNELSEAYNEQKAAEVALESAAKNNPYLNRDAVSSLKAYASEMQRLTGIGDEELMSLMTRLAATSRTESEIMDIMSASIDMAASGTMSLESAVTNLNKTYSGLAGELGESIPQVRALTAEQMKSGEAVKVVASIYSGMAKSVSDSTGGARKLSTAFKSLKEELGASFTGAMEPMKNFFAKLAQGWADAAKAKREYNEQLEAEKKAWEEASEAEKSNTATPEQRKILLEQSLEDVQSEIKMLEDYVENVATGLANSFAMGMDNESWDRIYSEVLEKNEGILQTQGMISSLKEKEKDLTRQISDLEKEITEEKEAQAKAEQQAEDDAVALGAIENYKKKIAAAEEELSLRRKLGEEITRQAELEELASLKTSAALEMVKEASGKISTDNSFFKQIQKDLSAIYAELAEIEGSGGLEVFPGSVEDSSQKLIEFKEILSSVTEENSLQWEKISDTIIDIAERFDELKDSLGPDAAAELADRIDRIKESLLSAKDEMPEWEILSAQAGGMENRAAELELKAKEASDARRLDLEKEYLDEAARLREQARQTEQQAEESASQAVRDKIASRFAQVAAYTQQITSIVTNACQLMSDTQENLLDAELADLEAGYRRGEITEEEYNEKVTEAKKKTAKEQYKIQMWQWSASILQATANIAEGITEAIAQGGVAGLITGSLVGAAGAVQLASVIASKPVPPSFSTGGIVGGSSYYGDRVQANLNSREMVLNMGQQKRLFDTINSGAIGAGATSIVINNSAANLVKAQPVLSMDKIELMIDARVNEGLKEGRYGKSLSAANQLMGGDFYGI